MQTFIITASMLGSRLPLEVWDYSKGGFMETKSKQSSEEFFARAIRNNIQKLPLSDVWRHACKRAEIEGITCLTYRQVLRISKLPAANR